MKPTNRVHSSKLHTPVLNLSAQIGIDEAYHRTLLAHADEIHRMGGKVEELGGEGSGMYVIDFSMAANCKPFKEFMVKLGDILPHDAFDSIYLYFNEALDPNDALINAFEQQRARLGLSSDYQPLGSPIHNVRTNGELVRDISNELPNDIEYSTRLERNERKRAKGRLYDLIGECSWNRDFQPSCDGGNFTDQHLNQMTRMITKMRTHALGLVRDDLSQER